jgi:hypothetical protein
MTSVAMRRPGASLAVGLGIAVGIVVLVLLISSIVHTMKHVKPVKPKKPPVSAVVWGDRVFVGPGGLSHWLKVRGIGYSVWAGRHPPANHLLLKQKALRDHKK